MIKRLSVCQLSGVKSCASSSKLLKDTLYTWKQPLMKAYEICFFFSPSLWVSSFYLRKGTVRLFIALMRFPQENFISRSFLALPKYFFLTFYFIYVCLMKSTSYIPRYVKLSFSISSLMGFWLGSSIPRVVSFFLFLYYNHCTFSNTEFYFYILAIYSATFYKGFLKFFSILDKYLYKVYHFPWFSISVLT